MDFTLEFKHPERGNIRINFVDVTLTRKNYVRWLLMGAVQLGIFDQVLAQEMTRAAKSIIDADPATLEKIKGFDKNA